MNISEKRKERTTLLKLSLAGSYFWGSFLFMIGGAGLAISEVLSYWIPKGQDMIELLSLVIMGCALVWGTVTYGVQQYNDTTRMIQILLWGLIGVYSLLVTFELVLQLISELMGRRIKFLFSNLVFWGLILATTILEIYTLVFHQESVQLFLKTHK